MPLKDLLFGFEGRIRRRDWWLWTIVLAFAYAIGSDATAIALGLSDVALIRGGRAAVIGDRSRSRDPVGMQREEAEDLLLALEVRLGVRSEVTACLVEGLALADAVEDVEDGLVFGLGIFAQRSHRRGRDRRQHKLRQNGLQFWFRQDICFELPCGQQVLFVTEEQ